MGRKVLLWAIPLLVVLGILSGRSPASPHSLQFPQGSISAMGQALQFPLQDSAPLSQFSFGAQGDWVGNVSVQFSNDGLHWTTFPTATITKISTGVTGAVVSGDTGDYVVTPIYGKVIQIIPTGWTRGTLYISGTLGMGVGSATIATTTGGGSGTAKATFTTSNPTITSGTSVTILAANSSRLYLEVDNTEATPVLISVNNGTLTGAVATAANPGILLVPGGSWHSPSNACPTAAVTCYQSSGSPTNLVSVTEGQ